MPWRRARKIVRWLAWIAGGLALLAVVATVVAWIALQSDWGREKVRAQLETALDKTFHGDVTVGGLEGPVLGDVTARDLVIRDRQGREAISVGRVRLEYHALDLLGQKLTADRVVLEGVVVVDRGNLGDLVIAGDEPSAWSVAIDELVVSGGHYRRVRPEPERDLEVRDVELEGGLFFAAETGLDATLSEASGTFRDIVAEVAGTLRYAENRVTADQTAIDIADSRVEIASGAYHIDGGAFEVRFDAAVTGADLRRLVPRWRGPVALAGTVSRASSGTPLALDAAGRLDDDPVSADLVLAPEVPRLSGRVELSGATPARWLEGAPDGELDLSADLDLAGDRLESLAGSAAIEANGRIAGTSVDALAGTVTVRDGRARAEFTASAIAYSGGRIKGATIDVSASPLRSAAVVSGEIRGDRLSYAKGVARAIRVSGRFDVDALAGAAKVTADRARYGKQRVGDLSASVDIDRRGKRIAGRVKTGVEVPDSAGLDLGIEARAVARIGERGTAIRVGRLLVRTNDVRWRGDAKLRVASSGGVAVGHLELRSPAGTLSASGRLGPGGRRGTVDLQATGVELERVVAALPKHQLPPLSGTASVSVTAELSPLRLDGQARVKRLRFDDRVPPLTGALELGSDGRSAEASVDLRTPEAGAVQVQVAVELPRRPLELASWQRIKRQRIKRVAAKLARVDLSRVGVLVPQAADLEGRLSGTASLEAGGDSFRLDLRLAGAKHSRLRRPLDLELSGSGDASSIAADLSVGARRQVLVRGGLELGVGVAAVWDGDTGALRRATLAAELEIPQMPLQQIVRHLELRRDVGGQLRGQVTARGTVSRPIADLDLRASGVKIGAIEPFDLRTRGSIDRERWNARATLSHEGGALRGRGEGGLALDAPVSASVEAERFNIGVLSPLLAERDLVLARLHGGVDLSMALEGTLAAPEVTGEARLHRGRARLRTGVKRLSEMEAKIELSDDNIFLTGRAESGGGDIAFTSDIGHRGLRPRSLHVEIEARELPLAAGSARADLDGELIVDGGDREGTWRLDARLHDGVVRMPERRESRELHPTSPPADVRFVDARARAARAEEADDDPLFDPLIIDIETPGGFRVLSGDGASVTGRADLVMVSRRGVTTLEGTVETTSGRVVLFDRKYRLNRAIASFDGRRPINPRIDLALEHSFDTADLFIRVDGTLQEPEVNLSSSPAIYSSSELLGFVLGGQPGGRPGGEGGLQGGAAALASSFLASQLESLIATPLPFDTVRIGTAEDSPGGVSSVTVGRWISEDVFVAYQHALDPEEDKSANEAVIEYRFLPRWVLEGVVGDRGTGSVDLLWIRRFD